MAIQQYLDDQSIVKMCHLKLLIEQEFTSLNDNIELCQAICRFVADHCQMCINTEGKQFGHLL